MPIEGSVGTLIELQREGKIGDIGVSKADAADPLRRVAGVRRGQRRRADVELTPDKVAAISTGQ